MTDLLQHDVSAPSEARTREIAALGPWFHNLHLPDGALTAPNHALGDFPLDVWTCISDSIPRDLAGWTALDIGCNSGFYSVELARRGARVTAMDVEPLFLRQAAWAAREYGVQELVEVRQGSVYDLARQDDSYDLVLFMGVLYHLRYPMVALDAVARSVRRMMVFQSLTMPGVEQEPDTARPRGIDDREDFLHPGWPKMAFIEHELAGDPTNWWAPNDSALQALLRSSGFRITSRPGRELYVCEPVPGSGAWSSARGAAEFAAAAGRVAPDATAFDAASGREASGAGDSMPAAMHVPPRT